MAFGLGKCAGAQGGRAGVRIGFAVASGDLSAFAEASADENGIVLLKQAPLEWPSARGSVLARRVVETGVRIGFDGPSI